MVPELLGPGCERLENMPTRDNAISTGYKLEWSRWEQIE